MPRFTSDEMKAQWLEKIRRTRAAKKAQQAEPTHAVMPVCTGVVDQGVSLEGKIAQLRAELAILEQAMEILSR